MKETDCELRVETRDGVLRFRLANHRVNADSMNNFHVNVPAAQCRRGQPRQDSGPGGSIPEKPIVRNLTLSKEEIYAVE
ncbi:MAG: hypothetical protein CMO80_19140 [Verrucomicrobiales bacterium]|nr:hypothetical protein [Verrucomicrobiales bacterium]